MMAACAACTVARLFAPQRARHGIHANSPLTAILARHRTSALRERLQQTNRSAACVPLSNCSTRTRAHCKPPRCSVPARAARRPIIDTRETDRADQESGPGEGRALRHTTCRHLRVRGMRLLVPSPCEPPFVIMTDFGARKGSNGPCSIATSRQRPPAAAATTAAPAASTTAAPAAASVLSCHSAATRRADEHGRQLFDCGARGAQVQVRARQAALPLLASPLARLQLLPPPGALAQEMSNASPCRFEPRKPRKNVPCQLTLRNPTGDPVAFKVKTTRPKTYCVRPSGGVVEPGSSKEVEVIMQAQREPPGALRWRAAQAGEQWHLRQQ